MCSRYDRNISALHRNLESHACMILPTEPKPHFLTVNNTREWKYFFIWHVWVIVCGCVFCQIKHNSCQLLTLSFYYSYGTAANSKTIKNSRLVSQKDDVHVCIMCLRAIMNYQVQDAQTWLVTKTSGMSAHSETVLLKVVWNLIKHKKLPVTLQIVFFYISVCPVYKNSTTSLLNNHCIMVNVLYSNHIASSFLTLVWLQPCHVSRACGQRNRPEFEQ